PADVLDAAQEAERDLLSATDDETIAKVIKDSAKVWRRAKPYLERVMDYKCWYCETKDVRSDNAIDHFRPKALYWWLAFRYWNFRFSCTFCNSRRRDPESGIVGGKAAEFPLVPGSARLVESNESVDDEIPLLLDPCIGQDPQLLWFDETG